MSINGRDESRRLQKNLVLRRLRWGLQRPSVF